MDDVSEGYDSNEGDRLEDMIHVVEENFDGNPAMFETLLSDSEKPLYNGCTKYTRLSSVLKLYNLKVGGGWSDASFTLLLEAVKDMLPEDNVLPGCTYEAKKILSTMGLRYEKIHACPNDCILYRNEYESLDDCPVCNTSRYKKKVGIPAKVLWYFPIIPRFRRMFSNPRDAEKLTWHHNGRTKDGLMRHPADSPQWRFIDETFPDFKKDERNLRLALSTDGMNPFGSLSSTYSTWPVILPGSDIDIYLQPLIDNLKIQWERGVEVFDAHRQEKFNLRAMLFCTIQDYPAYGNLSGKKAFDGKQMFERRPKVSTSEDVFAKIKDMQITFGKGNKKELPTQGYKKCSNLWSLPYWRLLFVRHSLDIMHIEKNVCDSLIGTLLNIPGKTKDGPNARDDLKEMNIRTELHPILKGSRNFLPLAAYTLSRKEKIQFCECLAGVKVPQGYSSNFSSLVSMQNLKLMGLKSYDCHVLMQQLLPVAIRGILPKNVRVHN
ncbi:uncharacterized protein LOC104893596 [Beta vulgaris subsp. vulgaris]|uniref:uncharacterized protein LOC104893596 n=1 Tax=Beta vulgaris subsp. vulgaris TaxID=3555 RepID=UPI002547ABFB|nr:uncharacterized protein LOC104893596 [Beta vulgaris subsp. vulgaris]